MEGHIPLIHITFTLFKGAVRVIINVSNFNQIYVHVTLNASLLQFCSPKPGSFLSRACGVKQSVFFVLVLKATHKLLSEWVWKADDSFSHLTCQQCVLSLLPGKVPFLHSSPTSIPSTQTAQSEEVSDKCVASYISLILRLQWRPLAKLIFLVTFHIYLGTRQQKSWTKRCFTRVLLVRTKFIH